MVCSGQCVHIWSTQSGQLVHSYLGTGGIFEVGPSSFSTYRPSPSPRPPLVLRIRDVHPDPGSEFFPSRIRIKEFKYLTPKSGFQALGNMNHISESSSRLLIRDPNFYLSRIANPGSRSQKGTGSRIRICNTAPPPITRGREEELDQWF